jgi:tRNA(Ile)-lysidine synthase
MKSGDIYKEFSGLLTSFPDVLNSGWLVGVSGGPDSMALCHMLSRLRAETGNSEFYVVTVDHGLRPESAVEARHVSEWLTGWRNVRHKILELDWGDGKPRTRIMEKAREGRNAAICKYARKKGIKHIFAAHHMDDQAETFLMRLAGGSGLDGLSAMNMFQPMESEIFCRPLLQFSKEEIISYCKSRDVPFVSDPSNNNLCYLRPRLRNAAQVLEKEGLSALRLARTATRLRRAREALERCAAEVYRKVSERHESGSVTIDYEKLAQEPEEIRLRVLSKCMEYMGGEGSYPPRLEKMEKLAVDMFSGGPFPRRTLGGYIFSVDRRKNEICLEKENK